MRKFVLVFLSSAIWCLGSAPITYGFQGPLHTHPQNPRYFTDNSGQIIYLAGSHTWANFQTFSPDNPPQETFDFSAYLDYLAQKNLNYTRLWIWEQGKQPSGWPTNYLITPLPFARTGPGTAAYDGQPKFDLTQLNQDFFDRLRQRVIEAGTKNIYVDIQLFNGWSVGAKSGEPSPFASHPMYVNNNINGINGDPNGDGNGYETQTLSNPSITAIQEAYVRKVIDSVNDLDNVLYEIANEAQGTSATVAWHNHFIDYIHAYEDTLPKQHPVGFTIPYPNGDNNSLFASNADWISPNGVYQTNPPTNTGSKIIISDTDHLWGLGGDRVWAWKSFTRGILPSYMDCYHEDELGCPISFNDPTRTSLIANLGHIRTYASKMDLVHLIPQTSLASTGYTLANPGIEYLIYQPNSESFTVNLLAATYTVEWFRPSTETTIQSGTLATNGTQTFTPPFSGDAVLYLKASNLPTPSPNPTPGDTDGDNDVDIFDYNAVVSDFSWTGTPGSIPTDIDKDGDVDIFDYNQVVTNFGM